MFDRHSFESIIGDAEAQLSHLNSNPEQLHSILKNIVQAVRVLADSCENDLKEQIQGLVAESSTGVDR
ncbi:hypothetical protein JET66_13670 [Pseudomonas putida]|uniref:hypothetical protein n=1 Tax=Pseudomonas putida TaxID=303 RepID=UPI0018E67ACB|nr:hypothetical protein [Pseudomonas putida]MBI6925699.1 hypothetical protein [Pseudomonas putida]